MLRSTFCALALIACNAVSAAPMLDQEVGLPPYGSSVIASFGSVGAISYAQSFRQSAGNIAGAGIELLATSEPVDVTISLYDALPHDGGAALASSVATGSVGWLEVFWSAHPTTPDTTYFLVIAPARAASMFWGNANGVYASGQAYDGSGNYVPLTGVDFVFRTYADIPAPIEIPEPASLLLVAMGLGLIAARSRRNVQPAAR